MRGLARASLPPPLVPVFVSHPPTLAVDTLGVERAAEGHVLANSTGYFLPPNVSFIKRFW